MRMNKSIQNVATLAMQRETNFNKWHNGMASKEMMAAAEEKAASCEMEEISCQLPENTRSTFLVAFSPDGTKVASAHGNHQIYVSDVRTGKCLHTLEGHPRTPWCLTFHPSYNDILASGCLGGEVRVWDLHGGCEIWAMETNSAIASLAFHPLDQVLVIATTNMVYFWNWCQSQPFARCKTATDKERVRFVRFDPYGHRLFTGIANVSAVYRLREEVRPMATREREQEESSLHERLFMLNEQHRQLLQRLQELQSQASGNRFQDDAPPPTVDPVEQPPSPTAADALRMARDYAADMAYPNPFRSNFPTRTERNRNLDPHPETSGSQSNLNSRNEPPSTSHEGSPRLSFQELQENLRSMRVRYTRICERLRELLMLRSRSSDNLASSNASDANLVYSLLTFWREYETLAISLQHSSLQYGTSGEPNRDARRHIAVAMVSLLQLQDMLHTSIMHQMNDVSERGMARLIHSILMTLLELATLDTNILALRTTALEAIGRTMHAQWASSIQRPEARRQRNTPSSASPPSTSTSSLPSVSRLNPMSWHSVSDSTTHQLAAFRHMLTTTPREEESAAESAFSQPRRASSSGHLSTESPRSGLPEAGPRTSIAMTRSLSLQNRPRMSNEGTPMEGEASRSSRNGARSRAPQPQEAPLNISSTEQLLRSILEELLNLLGSTNAASSMADGMPGSAAAADSSPSAHPSPSFPASWYPYWWNHLWNIRSASGLYSGLSDPILVTRATYRIQCWDFTKFQIPDISNSQVNVVVPECLIQNDANIEISADGRLLATLVPSSVPTSTLLAVHSLQPDNFGQCLYLWSFSSSVISISLSPLGRYALVGLGSNRRTLASHSGKLIIGQVLQLVEGRDEKKEYLQHVRTVELRGENRFDVSLNSMRWLPLPGEGLIYGTNRGDLRICRPRSCMDPCWVKPITQPATSIPRQAYRDIVARVLARRPSFHHPSFTRLVFPTTSTTGTQTESDSD